MKLISVLTHLNARHFIKSRRYVSVLDRYILSQPANHEDSLQTAGQPVIGSIRCKQRSAVATAVSEKQALV